MPARDNHNFKGLEASSLFCPNCGKAQPVFSKLLLALPQGDKIAYMCKVCGAKLADKMQEGPQDRGHAVN